jgi:hypothetical protein
MTSWQTAAENTNRNNADNKMQFVMTDERLKQGALELGTAMALEGDPYREGCRRD